MKKINKLRKFGKSSVKSLGLALVFLFTLAPIAFADPVTGDSVGNWLLDWGKWAVVLGVAFLSIKEFVKGAKVVAFVVIVAGSILYFYMNDPEGFLNGLSFIPKFFTGQ